MPKLTIYVPDALHERMEEVTANWSAIAQQAFKRELLRIEAMTNTDDIVARLRASKAECRNEDEEAGKTSGVEWARTQADYRELKRCETAWHHMSRENMAVDLDYLCEHVLKIEHRSDVQEFVEQWLGEDATVEDATDDWVEGSAL